MLKKIKKEYCQTNYKFLVGEKSNIHKVSYFYNNYNFENKKILFLDFEFSREYNIYEVGGLILENGKITKKIFKEFKLPLSNSIFNFDTKRMDPVTNSFNKGKEELNPQKILDLVESVDYVVCHNYVAEMKCILKLRFPDLDYDISNCDMMRNKKVICTNYSFSNKYFKNEFNLCDFSNSGISNRLNWKVSLKDKEIIIKNKAIDKNFKIIPPKSFFKAKNKNLHNSFYDSVVTLTNFLSCKYIKEDIT